MNNVKTEKKEKKIKVVLYSLAPTNNKIIKNKPSKNNEFIKNIFIKR